MILSRGGSSGLFHTLEGQNYGTLLLGGGVSAIWSSFLHTALLDVFNKSFWTAAAYPSTPKLTIRYDAAHRQ
jgi:hypothetical protein